ncbi:MAG: hypothetical protein JKX84_05740, partial [Flavobacteriales bacterium]|nr:hypothetical protein [Flavobacteriales bacterium]
MKKLYIAILAVLLCSQTLQAQVNHQGEPFRWETPSQSDNVAFVQMPTLDMEAITEEDSESDKYKEFSYRFGIERTVNLNTDNNGTWTSEGDLNIWRLGVHAPAAKAVSFLFKEFELPKTAKLFIYDKERTHFIGAFNYTNQQANGMLATSLVYSENVIIELQIPADQDLSDLRLSIGQIVHAYRGLDSKFEELKAGDRDPFGTSGSCNIGINCPEGSEWQIEKQSVAIITSGGGAVCTGALVNNTANDGYPYFLTANHCLGGGVDNWVFYFNHEASTCNGNSGPTNNSVSGASIVANNANSDFGLLEINNGNDIPANFDAEFAGWDNSDSPAAVTASIGIH